MISCCFCDRIIPEDDVYVLSLNYPDETDQEWVCHRNCFRAALHPDYRYFDDEELDEARFPSTHLRAKEEVENKEFSIWPYSEEEYARGATPLLDPKGSKEDELWSHVQGSKYYFESSEQQAEAPQGEDDFLERCLRDYYDFVKSF